MAVVGALALARVALAISGGQSFLNDEQRYDRGIELYRACLHADLAGVGRVLAQPEHALFPVVGAAVTGVQHLLAQVTPYGDWTRPEHAVYTLWLGAAVLSLFAAFNVYLVYRLARAAGAGAEEAFWSAALLAGACSPFYFARHLLPYHCAITAALAALVTGFSATRARQAAVAGALTAATFHLYNGYWYLVPVVATACAWWWRTHAGRRPLWVAGAAGAIAGLVLPLAIGTAAGGRTYWSTLDAFQRSATQGLFAEGWLLPWRFLWHAEGAWGVIVLLGIGVAVAASRRRRERIPARVALWCGLLALSYALLVGFSNGLARFVVYGRTVLPWTVFLALLGGWAASRLLSAHTWRQVLGFGALAGFAGLNFAPHFSIVFPPQMEIAVLRQFGNPKRALTYSGSIYIPLAMPVTRPELALVDTQWLYPVRSYVGSPAGNDVMRVGHPLSFPGYQYEGHTPRERTLLRAHGLSMRLIRLQNPAAVPDHPPPAMLYQPDERPTGR